MVLSLTSTCELEAYSSIGATTSAPGTAPNPTCGLYQGGDVWFKFEVPASGYFRVHMTSSSTNSQYALYSGSCGDFEQLFCVTANSQMLRTYYYPDLIGEEVYLRAYRYNSAAGIDFNMCVSNVIPPSNDLCEDAMTLNLDASCEYESYTSIGASTSVVGTAPNPTCGLYQGGDVWFKFEVPASGYFRVQMTSSGTNSQYALYSGSCGDFEQLVCATSSNQMSNNYHYPDLSGELVYLRAYRYNSVAGIDFNLCVSTLTPPVNNFCSDAIALNVGSSCDAQSYTSEFATTDPGSGAGSSSCSGFVANEVWFTFQVPASGNFRMEISSAGSNAVWKMYTGVCGELEEVYCSSQTFNLSNNYSNPDLAGETIYLMVHRFLNYSAIEFNLCLQEITLPENNFCADATPLAVGETCDQESFTNLYATIDPNNDLGNSSCSGHFGNEVWFTFEVPVSGNFRIEISSPGNAAIWTMYSGECGDLEEAFCSSSNTSLTRNFVAPELAGETIYLRVSRYVSLNSIDFDFCIQETTPPENNFCVDAFTLSVGEECEFDEVYTFEYSTTDGSIPNPSCGGFNLGDVWFAFEAPESGQFAIERNNIGSSNIYYTVYSGTCGDFTQVACGSSALQNFNDPSLGGQTLYIRAYSAFNANSKEFELCVRNTTISVNDNCADAIPVDVGTFCGYQTFDNLNATVESEVLVGNACGGNSGSDVWFTITVPESEELRIRLQNLPGQGLFYGELMSGTCGDFESLACQYGTGFVDVDLPGQAGEVLYLRVYRSSSSASGDFNLCVIDRTCGADINNDGVVNSSDLSAFLAEFGCVSNCTVDLNNDGVVNSSDLSLFLSAFGGSCE